MAAVHSQMLPLGTTAPDFALTDAVSGNEVRRADHAGKPLVVAFISNHCPYVKLIRKGLASFGKDMGGKGVAVLAIGSNDAERYPADGPDAMKREAAEWGYTFAYLHDATQEVAKAYRAACTPDFYLFDADHKLVYRGQFDAARPGGSAQVTGKDLRAAVDAVLAGKAVNDAQTPSIGCNIKWKPGNEPDYFG